MERRSVLAAGVAAFAGPIVPLCFSAPDEDDTDEPLTRPPRQATILFEGKDLSAWMSEKGDAPTWKLENGYVEAVPGTGNILTRELFRDFQLHVEFRIPDDPGKGRGNSGVYLQNMYEIQIIDSYGRPPELSGCGALYREVAPMRNASKKPGRWQSYDIAFRAPRFDESGQTLSEKGLLTVFQNRILIQNNIQIPGMTGQAKKNPANDPRKPGPIVLQNHSNPVRFRNIWIVGG